MGLAGGCLHATVAISPGSIVSVEDGAPVGSGEDDDGEDEVNEGAGVLDGPARDELELDPNVWIFAHLD
jgi:hypothetical protein